MITPHGYEIKIKLRWVDEVQSKISRYNASISVFLMLDFQMFEIWKSWSELILLWCGQSTETQWTSKLLLMFDLAVRRCYGTNANAFDHAPLDATGSNSVNSTGSVRSTTSRASNMSSGSSLHPPSPIGPGPRVNSRGYVDEVQPLRPTADAPTNTHMPHSKRSSISSEAPSSRSSISSVSSVVMTDLCMSALLHSQRSAHQVAGPCAA